MEHFDDCATNKTQVHNCPSQERILKHRLYKPVVEYDCEYWTLYAQARGYINITIPVEFCPFCGEELPEIECNCEDIAQGFKEQEIYFKTDGYLP